MQLSIISDNSEVLQEELAAIPALREKITDKRLETLEREGIFVFPDHVQDSPDLQRDQFVLRSDGTAFRTGNVMGFLGLQQERLIISSRFRTQPEDYFLKYLLERVIDTPNVVDLFTNASQTDRLYAFLAFVFPHYLRAALRKGLFRSYVYQLHNDENVRGNIDIARQLEINTPFTGKFVYSTREFSQDNYLTQLVRHTIEYLAQKSYGRKLLSPVREEVQAVVQATRTFSPSQRIHVIQDNIRHKVQHAYFKEYLALQQLCLLILQEKKHQIGAGPLQLCGILFDGAWLWEEYLNTLLGDLCYHSRNKASFGSQRLFEGNVGKVYPDFLGRDTAHPLVADAKYKPVENIGRRDYLQILAYMYRFDAKIGYFLYPDRKQEESQWLPLLQGSTFHRNVEPRADVGVIKHGLHIPTGDTSYAEFTTHMHASEAAFCEALARPV